MHVTSLLPLQDKSFHFNRIFLLTSLSTNGTVSVMTREELTNWRKKHNLKQEDLARLLDVSRVCVTRWEHGTRKVPPFLHWALESISKHLKRKGGEKRYGMREKKRQKMGN